MSVPSGLGGSFVSQVLYTYMQFPVLEWRKDTIFTNYDFHLGDFNVYEPTGSPGDNQKCGKDEPSGGGGEGGGGGGRGGRGPTKCPPCGQKIRHGEGTVQLNWNAVPDVKRYIVQWSRSPSCRGRGTRATSVGPGQTSYALKIGVDVVPGEQICYRVTAIGQEGQTSSGDCKCLGVCPVRVDNLEQLADLGEKCCEAAGVEIKIEGPDTIDCCCNPETYQSKITMKGGGGGGDGQDKFEIVAGSTTWSMYNHAGKAKFEGNDKVRDEAISPREKGESCSIVGIGKAGKPRPNRPGEDTGYEPEGGGEPKKFDLFVTVTIRNTTTNEEFHCVEMKEVTLDCKSSNIEKKPWLGQNSQLHQLRQLHPSCLTIWKSLCAQLMRGNIQLENPVTGEPLFDDMGPGGKSFGFTSPLNRFGSAPSIYTGYRYDPWAGTNFYGYSGYGYFSNYWANYQVTKFGGAFMLDFQHDPVPQAVDGSSRPSSPAASGEGPANIRTLGIAGEFLGPYTVQRLRGMRSAIVMKPTETQWESTYGVTWGPPVRALKSFLTNDLYLDQVTTSGGWETGVNQFLDGSYFSYTLNLGDVGMHAGALTIKQPGRYWVTANIEAEGQHTLGNFTGGFAGQDCKIGYEAHITKNGIAQLESQVLTKAFTGTTRETQRITSSKKILMHLERGDVLGLVVRKQTGTYALSGTGGSFNDQWMSPTIKGTNTFITLEPISSVNY